MSWRALASGIAPGDQLHTPDNTWVTVQSIEATGHARTVHNLEIEDLHTCHVHTGTTWTTVHNSCTVDKVIQETQQGKGNITSQFKLTEDEALEVGEKWLGNEYSEIGRSGQGVFRSADGTRQFRIDDGSLTRAHSPGVPHVHLEAFSPGANYPYVNNHIPLIR